MTDPRSERTPVREAEQTIDYVAYLADLAKSIQAFLQNPNEEDNKTLRKALRPNNIEFVRKGLLASLPELRARTLDEILPQPTAEEKQWNLEYRTLREKKHALDIVHLIGEGFQTGRWAEPAGEEETALYLVGSGVTLEQAQTMDLKAFQEARRGAYGAGLKEQTKQLIQDPFVRGFISTHPELEDVLVRRYESVPLIRDQLLAQEPDLKESERLDDVAAYLGGVGFKLEDMPDLTSADIEALIEHLRAITPDEEHRKGIYGGVLSPDYFDYALHGY
ncbi:Hypothetical protein POVN_LOCUS706 [uncultured virus]|nr:Hypothetical protein POVN_LOCUS706 [uncultured virus]